MDGAPAARDTFIVDIDGFEGPLDLLLDLARRQKVDLARISILALAEQYLAFVEEYRKQRLDLAADYLVLAAWLAYLKSRLLIPEPPSDTEEPPATILAAALAFRLKRLEAMRNAARRLSEGSLLGRDRFVRGLGEVPEAAAPRAEATLFELLTAYCEQRARGVLATVTMTARTVWSLAEARAVLERMLGHSVEWIALDGFLADFAPSGIERASILASGLNATLELTREGHLDLRQEYLFGPLFIRQRPASA